MACGCLRVMVGAGDGEVGPRRPCDPSPGRRQRRAGTAVCAAADACRALNARICGAHRGGEPRRPRTRAASLCIERRHRESGWLPLFREVDIKEQWPPKIANFPSREGEIRSSELVPS